MTRARKMNADGGLRLAALNGAQVPAGSVEPYARVRPAIPPLEAYAEQTDLLADEMGPITAAACAAMDDEMLGCMRETFAADLAIIEAEYRARQELAQQQAKRMRRAVVDASARPSRGEVLRAEAGNDIAYAYSGTAWKLTAAAARQRGLPDLAGRTVCYAYGQPLLGAGRRGPALRPAPVTNADDEIPF